MEFRKYQHIERFGTDEVDGIEFGKCYIFYKIDGTNGSLWLDDDGNLKAGSRNRELTLENDNAGFYNEVIKNRNIKGYLTKHPTHRLFGEWLCLSGDTKIRLVSGGKRGHTMTLKEIYEYANMPVEEVANYTKKNGVKSVTIREPWWKRYGYPQLFTLHIDDDIIKPHRMQNIIYTGKKDVYKITTRKGFTIKSTLEHKFLTNYGWTQLKEIKVDDVVAVSPLKLYPNERIRRKRSREIDRIQDAYKESIGKCEKCGLATCLEIHHIDLNPNNNAESNLKVLCRECHKWLHKDNIKANYDYNYEFDKVISIERIGEEDCYDITMEGYDENTANFVANGFIVHNCPHTLKTYREDAWKKFYVFDVCIDKEDGTMEYIPYDIYKTMLDEFNIDYIPPLAIITNPTYESLIKCLDKTGQFLIEDGKGLGEGIVIKNYDFYNKYKRQTWAKIVTNEFKEKHHKEMGCPEYKAEKMIEEKIVEDFCTDTFIEKEYAKIVNEQGGWQSKYIPMLLGRVFSELIKEESWNIVKTYKYPKINYKTLNALVIQKIKQTKKDVFA